MGTALIEQLPRNEGFIVSEAPGTLSREQVVVARAAAIIPAGTVMIVRDDGKYEPLDPASSEQPNLTATSALSILCSDVDSTVADAAGAVVERLAEVRASDLHYYAGITTAAQDTAELALLARNIKVRAVAARVTTQST